MGSFTNKSLATHQVITKNPYGIGTVKVRSARHQAEDFDGYIIDVVPPLGPTQAEFIRKIGGAANNNLVTGHTIITISKDASEHLILDPENTDESSYDQEDFAIVGNAFAKMFYADGETDIPY